MASPESGFPQKIPQKEIPDRVEVENFPFEKQFTAFMAAAQKVAAEESDAPPEIGKEYISTVKLFPLYEDAFGPEAVNFRAVNFRIGHIFGAGTYKGDFVANENRRGGSEPMYFVKLSNLQLLKDLFVPNSNEHAKNLAQTERTQGQDAQAFRELYGSQDEQEEED